MIKPDGIPSTIAWASYAAGVGFLGLGLRGLLAPSGAAAFFGVPVSDPAGLTFVRAYGARNIGISLTALALTAIDARAGLTWLLLAAALISVFDSWITISSYGWRKGVKHLAYIVALTAFAAWVAQG